jgi:hypothetical protein
MCDSPDAIVKIQDEVWGIEITAYRQNHPRKSVEPSDAQLKNQIADTWYNNPDVQTVTPYLAYKMAAHNRVETVPRPRYHADVCEELLCLVRSCRAKLASKPACVTFDEPGKRRLKLPWGPNISVDRAHFPVLAKHCEYVMLTLHPECLGIVASSSLNGGAGGADLQALERSIRDKAALAHRYRQNLPRAKMGLLIHTEVMPFTARIGPQEALQGAVQYARDIHDALGRPFDALWLIENAQSGERYAELYVIA